MIPHLYALCYDQKVKLPSKRIFRRTKFASNFGCLIVHRDRIVCESGIILFLISPIISPVFYPLDSLGFARNCRTFCFVPGVKGQGDVSQELCVPSTLFKRGALRDLSAVMSFPLASQLACLNS